MATKVICECGTRVARKHLAHHQRSRWHAAATTARGLRKLGLSYAEIAAALARKGTPIQRCYIHRVLSREGL